MDDKVLVFHAGNEEKGIKGTGKERFMGRIQFDSWGKNNGWKEKPTANKTTDNAGTSDQKDAANQNGTNENNGGSIVELSKDASTKIATSVIKELGKAGKTDEIKAYVEGDTRSTITNAAKKFLTAK